VTEAKYWEPKWSPCTGSHPSEENRLYPVGLRERQV
jgi:hypothetical protein